jgi:hypothetical protein
MTLRVVGSVNYDSEIPQSAIRCRSRLQINGGEQVILIGVVTTIL